MKSRLESGAAGAKRSGSFVEPVSAPGALAGVTLDDVMGVCPVADNTAGATASDVSTGKTFWGLRTDGTWGLTTGTLSSVPSAVPATGQTTSYAAGDDGDTEIGVALPTPRFTKHGDGTVTDHLTGLVWLEKANCIASDNASFDQDGTVGDGLVTWQHALDFVAGVNAGTYGCGDTSNGGSYQTDWRLPNLREQQSLMHYGYYGPAISNAAGTGQWLEGDPFAGVVSVHYWSSTTLAGYAAIGWYVHLGSGFVNYDNKTLTYYVWPVRAGQ